MEVKIIIRYCIYFGITIVMLYQIIDVIIDYSAGRTVVSTSFEHFQQTKPISTTICLRKYYIINNITNVYKSNYVKSDYLREMSDFMKIFNKFQHINNE